MFQYLPSGAILKLLSTLTLSTVLKTNISYKMSFRFGSSMLPHDQSHPSLLGIFWKYSYIILIALAKRMV